MLFVVCDVYCCPFRQQTYIKNSESPLCDCAKMGLYHHFDIMTERGDEDIDADNGQKMGRETKSSPH